MRRMATLFLGTASFAIALLPGISGAQQSKVVRSQDDSLSSPTGVPRLAGESANPLLIALAPAVQSELKLSDAQKTQIQRLAGQGRGGPAPDVDPYDGAENQGNARRQAAQSLGRILDRRQRERLHQIVLRAEGPVAVARPEVSDKLNLMPEQVAAIQTVMAQWQQSQDEALGMARANSAFGAEPNPDEYARLRLASSRLRIRVGEQLGQILDRRQKNIFDRMLGAPFDIRKLSEKSDSADPSKSNAATPAVPQDQDAATAKAAESPKGKSDLPKRRRGKKSAPKSGS